MTCWWQRKNLNPSLFNPESHSLHPQPPSPTGHQGHHEPHSPGNSEHLQEKSRNELDKPTKFSHNRYIC